MKISWRRFFIIEFGILICALLFQAWVGIRNGKLEFDVLSVSFMFPFISAHLILIFVESINETANIIYLVKSKKLTRIIFRKALITEIGVLLCVIYVPIIFYLTRNNYTIKSFMMDFSISWICFHLLIFLCQLQIYFHNKYYK